MFPLNMFSKNYYLHTLGDFFPYKKWQVKNYSRKHTLKQNISTETDENEVVCFYKQQEKFLVMVHL